MIKKCISIFSLVMMLIIFQQAEARVRDPRGDNMSVACGSIQDKLDAVVKEAIAASKAGDRKAYNDAVTRGRMLVREWEEIGCDAGFGNWWKNIKQANPTFFDSHFSPKASSENIKVAPSTPKKTTPLKAWKVVPYVIVPSMK